MNSSGRCIHMDAGTGRNVSWPGFVATMVTIYIAVLTREVANFEGARLASALGPGLCPQTPPSDSS
eukprot:6591332-Pyramimonas_sp.AAC.2